MTAVDGRFVIPTPAVPWESDRICKALIKWSSARKYEFSSNTHVPIVSVGTPLENVAAPLLYKFVDLHRPRQGYVNSSGVRKSNQTTEFYPPNFDCKFTMWEFFVQ